MSRAPNDEDRAQGPASETVVAIPHTNRPTAEAVGAFDLSDTSRRGGDAIPGGG
jgi:hypothetical protein